jgi:tetratricopeptide (TPR) repeat protein
MDLFPDQAIGYYFNGLGQWLKGEAKAALKVLEPSLIMASANPRLQTQMYKLVGLAHAQLGEYDKSDKAFDNALSMQPNDAEILSEYSRCLVLRTEKTNQALQMGKQANDIAPNVPLYQSNYAYVLYKLQRYAEAKDWLNKAIDNGGSNDPLILERLGDVHFRLGDVDKAIEQWQRAVNLGSFSTILRKKIETRKLYE